MELRDPDTKHAFKNELQNRFAIPIPSFKKKKK